MGWDVPVDGAYPADPRRRRRQALQAARRARRRGLSRAWAICRRRCKNYLVRLGWSHGDDEIMSLDDMIRWFEIEDVNKGAARFDFQKLEALNGVYMRQMDERRTRSTSSIAHPALSGERQADPRPARRAPQGAVARRHAWPEGAREDAGRACRWCVVPVRRASACRSTRRPPRCSARPQPGHSAGRARGAAGGRGDWNAASAEAAIREYASASGLKLGEIAQPLRAALTGRQHLARCVRRAGRARPRRKPGPDRRSNRLGQPGCPKEILKSHVVAVQHCCRASSLAAIRRMR